MQNSSLILSNILFKTVVLTKMMYAAPIWLQSNVDTFKDFWSRAILKISGSEYNPKRIIVEVATGIPPMNLILEEIGMKFVLKYQTDEVFHALFAQIECNRGHPFHSHVQGAMKYVEWKRFLQNTPKTRRKLTFMEIAPDEFTYDKNIIKQFMCYRWADHIKSSIDEDSEFFESLEERLPYLHLDIYKALFPRYCIKVYFWNRLREKQC